jgi:hypothetical protein
MILLSDTEIRGKLECFSFDKIIVYQKPLAYWNFQHGMNTT